MYRQQANKVNGSDSDNELDYDLVMSPADDLEDQDPDQILLPVSLPEGQKQVSAIKQTIPRDSNRSQHQNMNDYDPSYGRDLCPVCHAMFLESGQKYCSQYCLKTANLYRRRLSKAIRAMRKTGFDTHYENGVVIKISLPRAIQCFFPVSAQVMYFPNVLEEVSNVTDKTLYADLAQFIGPQLANNLEMLTYVERFWFTDFASMFHEMAKHAMADSEATFTCSNCNVKYIKSPYTYSPEDERCEDCTAARIPF